MLHLHNRILPTWLHRLAQGLLTLAAVPTFVAVATPYVRSSIVGWLLGILLVFSPILALLAGCLAPRWSIVEGIAGEDGYDELQVPARDNATSGPPPRAI